MTSMKSHMNHTLRIIGLLLIIQNMLLAKNNINHDNNQTHKKVEKEMVHMDSMGEKSMLLLIIFTSLVGSFFLRDHANGLVQV